MTALRLNATIKKNGELALTGLPYKKGEQVELIVVSYPTPRAKRRVLTARRLRRSPLIGLWKNRADIGESADFARRLRNQAQHR